MSLCLQIACPSLLVKLPVSCATTRAWSSIERECFAKKGGQGGLINVQAPSGLCPCLQGLMQCPEEVRSSKARKGLGTSYLGFLFPEQIVCQGPSHHCGNCMFVQTCQYEEDCYLNCVQSLHKRLSMRSCYCSGVLITPWRDVIVLALHTSVGVFLKEVAFVAPSWWLLSRSCSLHQGDILEWQCDTSLRRRRSAQQGTVTSVCCFPVLPVFCKGECLWFSSVFHHS